MECDLHTIENMLDDLHGKLRIAVLYAGDSKEPGTVLRRTHNPRHWKSYQSVAEDIAQALYLCGFRRVVTLAEDCNLAGRLKSKKIDLVWINSGGVQGHDPVCHSAALLESFGIPYIGHRPAAAATMDNKYLFKRLLQGIGLPTPCFMQWHPSQGPLNTDEIRIELANCPGPYVLKPVNGRASRNVEYVENVADLPETAHQIFEATHNAVLIESYLPGREFCVGGTGPIVYRAGQLELLETILAFAHLERVLVDEPIFRSMDLQPMDGSRAHLIDPGKEPQIIHTLDHLCVNVFKCLRLNFLIRIDVRADVDGCLQILEANPKPDLKRPQEKRSSLLAMGLAEIGMSYEDLVLSQLANWLAYAISYESPAVCHVAEYYGIQK